MVRERLRGVWNGICETNDSETDSSEGTDSGESGGAGAGVDSKGDPDRSRADRESIPALFACPECGTVYIAADKETCRICRTAVTDVRAPAATTEG